MRSERRAEVGDALPFALVESVFDRFEGACTVSDLLADEQVQTFFASVVAASPAGRAAELSASGFRQDLLLAWHLVAYARAGKWLYQVSEGLAQKLRYTDLRSLTCDDLRLPYPAILISVPSSADLKVSLLDGREGGVTEIYMVEPPVAPRRWHLLVVGRDATVEAKRYIGLRLPEGASISDAIALSNEELAQAPDVVPPLVLNGRTLNESSTVLAGHSARAALADWEPLFRWAMNVVVYATSSEDRVELWENKDAERLRERVARAEGREKKRLKEHLRAMDPGRRIVLGPNVAALPVSAAGEGHAVLVRTLVAGHWKMQPCGPQRMNRRKIFVQPYWRGDEDLPAAPGGVHVLGK
jgi:hypothetical protein